MGRDMLPPVAIFGFIRPHTTAQVFARVREMQPSKLFLCLDAPREGRPADIEKCEAVKKIFEGVDWPCEVFKNYAEKNMGCRRRMASGISWVFEHVEEAILLEDDCVPHPSFFQFCGELLERYRHDMRVGMIAGHVEHGRSLNKATSYYFDRFPTIIGWATWRRAWATFDAELEHWPRVKCTPCLEVVFPERRQIRRIEGWFDGVFHGKADSWATAWWLTFLRQGFLCAHPSVNLITNIGFGADSAHTTDRGSFCDNRPSEAMPFPLIHPLELVADIQEERNVLYYCYVPPYWRQILFRLRTRAKKLLSSVKLTSTPPP